MWICLNDAFFSIVSKGCARDELLVRARRKGDIEKLFPRAKVEKTPLADYAFRAIVGRDEVGRVLVGEVQRINYENFKDSVPDVPLHNAYSRVWSTLATLQASPPYGSLLFAHEVDPPPARGKKRARKLGRRGQ